MTTIGGIVARTTDSVQIRGGAVATDNPVPQGRAPDTKALYIPGLVGMTRIAVDVNAAIDYPIYGAPVSSLGQGIKERRTLKIGPVAFLGERAGSVREDDK